MIWKLKRSPRRHRTTLVGCAMAALMAACSSGAGSAEHPGQGTQGIETEGGQCIDVANSDSAVTWHAQDDGTCVDADESICALESQVKSIITNSGGDPNADGVLLYTQGSDGNSYYVLMAIAAGGDTASINAQLPNVASQYPNPPVSAQMAPMCSDTTVSQNAGSESTASRDFSGNADGGTTSSDSVDNSQSAGSHTQVGQSADHTFNYLTWDPACPSCIRTSIR